MLFFIAKAVFGGLTIALVATIARRHPGWGGLLAALPLTSILALTWLWIDTREAEPVAALATSILWFILPSLPVFMRPARDAARRRRLLGGDGDRVSRGRWCSTR